MWLVSRRASAPHLVARMSLPDRGGSGEPPMLLEDSCLQPSNASAATNGEERKSRGETSQEREGHRPVGIGRKNRFSRAEPRTQQLNIAKLCCDSPALKLVPLTSACSSLLLRLAAVKRDEHEHNGVIAASLATGWSVCSSLPRPSTARGAN